MSNKGKPSIREAEIEKCREDGSWKKVIELSEDMKKRFPSTEALANFLLAEARLELHLDEFPPTEQHHSTARLELTLVRAALRTAASTESNQKELGIDANLLLAKLNYTLGSYEEALADLTHAGLDSLAKRQLPVRSLRIVAESFAVKGLCLDRMPLSCSSKYRQGERQEAVLCALELASDLALLYLQEMDRSGTGQSTWSVHTAGSSSSPLPPVSESKLGFILETALQKTPVLIMKAGQMSRAVQRYRCILSAAETSATQTVRLNAAHRLAEMLLRGVSDRAYDKLDGILMNESKKTSVGGRAVASPWKPRRQMGANFFVPKEINEEIVLLLLISEALAVREAVLTQSPETSTARHSSYQLAGTVYDLMTLALVRKGQAAMVCESLERALRFSFEGAHIWRQYSLTLATAGHWQRALLVTDEAARLNPADPSLPLHAAKLCYQHLHKYEEGVAWSERALSCCSIEGADEDVLLRSRCHLYLGIGHMLQSGVSNQRQQRHLLSQTALKHFNSCHQLDPGDHLAEFYLAYQLSRDRQVTTALGHVQQALNRRPDHLHSLHLLTLLLTAHNRHSDALQLLVAALEEYPDNLQLMHVRSHLEQHCNGGEMALCVARDMLEQWRRLYDSRVPESSPGGGENGRAGMSTAGSDANTASAPTSSGGDEVESVGPGGLSAGMYTPVIQSQMAALVAPLFGPAHPVTAHLRSPVHQHQSTTYRWPASVCAPSTVAACSAIGDGALSEIDSSLTSSHLRAGPQQMWGLQIQMWLLIAELYLKLDQVDEAVSCVQEASSIAPASHLIMHLKGLVHEHKREFEEARIQFTDALSLNPNHVTSLQHLGLIHHYLGSHRLAEKVLRDAIQREPLLHQAWYNLGKVLEHLGEFEAASDCFMTSVDIEASAPILPFTTVPLCFE